MFPLGRQLAAIRILYGINQEDLAKTIGISRVQLSFFENGKVMLNPDTIQKLASVLDEKGIAPKVIIELPKELTVAA